jgi:diguanylate cyclase (GGDEF)-like protein
VTAARAGDPRIILVGRTGLEGKLRPFGPVRVRRALDAIGELADPMPEGGREGAPVVVVGTDADPGAGEGRAADFVRALRRVEPSVRILRAGGEGAQGAYDGVVTASDTLETMIVAMSGHAPSRAVAPLPEDAALPPARIEFNVEGRTVGASVGDAELVGLLIRGLDLVPAAERLVRERAGQPGLRFIPAGGPMEDGVPVAWQGHEFGTLVGGVAGADLAVHASWMAGWLALAAQQAQLRGQAFTDSLTGAWNRRYFDRFMEAALEDARRERRNLTILVFDIDDFKQYNDRFGHGAGDAILIETVRLLKSVIRPSDKVCRIGGDEFAVIFHEPDGPREATSRHPDSISEIAKRFQRQICEHRFPKLLEQAPGTLAISGGLATFPWDGRTAAELVARADELALQAKRAGKNTIVFGPGATEVCGID